MDVIILCSEFRGSQKELQMAGAFNFVNYTENFIDLRDLADSCRLGRVGLPE